MNRLLTILYVTIITGAVSQAQNSVISGTVYYDHYQGQVSIPMIIHGGVYVELTLNGVTLATDTTDANGHFTFENLATGTYQLVLTTNLPWWGGGSGNDQLAVMRHYVELPPLLSGLRLQAAHVRGLPAMNAADAMIMARRFVGQISSFLAGDWIFESPVITVDGSQSYTLDVYGISFGDTNGSNQPPPGP